MDNYLNLEETTNDDDESVIVATQDETQIGTQTAGVGVFMNYNSGGHVVLTQEWPQGFGLAAFAPYSGEVCEDPFGGAELSA